MSQPSGDSISGAMLRDHHALKRIRREWKQSTQAAESVKLGERFEQRLSESLALASARRAQVPKVTFGQDLPIMEWQDEIVETIRNHQVVVISGETGSGKSTQIPKFCLHAGFGVRGLIGHTQPRRIAARTIAQRVAEELNSSVGEAVGFKIRFTDKTHDRTFIKLMTDGILLAETQGDRFLDKYEVIIIDEAHERSLNIDFLLGYLHQRLPKRPELRVIITSATIDAERFCQHFATEDGPAPLIEVSGRGYPVETRYRPLTKETTSAENDDEVEQIDGIVRAVEELAAIDRGHILIFLPTEREIRETAKRLGNLKLRGDGSKGTEILPLYARLTAAEQNRVFQHADHRRIVLATNVAESSLTVPGIRYVIDTGTARISRYTPRSKVQRLPIEAVSRASADQRLGRCGRVAPGVCIRLYSEEDYLGRRDFTTPEIQRTNLASVILRAKSLELGRVEDFPFLDMPRPDSIRDGYSTLFELGAVDDRRQLTKRGRQLSRFPVDPRIARIILGGHEQNCLAEILIIAAALEIQDPRERPLDRQQQADEQHAKFDDEQSDFLSYLKLWDFYQDQREKLSHSRLRRACKQNFLSSNRMREWSEIYRQLMQLARDNQLRWQARNDDPQSIHLALLTGFLSGVAYRSGDHEYTGAGGVKFHLWPGSGQFKAKPKWCLVTEILETSRQYGRTVGRIQPTWVEPLAEHVIKRQYTDPHWHQKSETVMAWETATLYGLPIVTRHRVPFGPISPEEASEIFVRDGLAARKLDISDKFYQHNKQIIAECESRADKTRNAELIVDEYTLYRFYNQRLPIEVYDVATLRKWVKDDPQHRATIRMHVEDLLPEHHEPEEESFPSEIELGSLRLPVDYSFAPGEEQDGATVTIPEAGLSQCTPGQIEWGVPGLLEKKIVAIIRSLPKPIRRGLIPAPDVAKRVAAELTFGEGDFINAVVQKLSAINGEAIPRDAFRWEKVPPHLRLNVRIVNADGETLAEGRDVAAVREQLGTTADTAVVSVGSLDDGDWHRVGITEWDFGELPAQVPIVRNGIEIAAYPSLLDRGEHVDMCLLGSSELSRRQTRSGIRRLFALRARKSLRSQVNWLPRYDEICVWSAPIIAKKALSQQVTDLIADRALFQPREKLPRDQAQFENRLENVAERIGIATQDVATLLPKIFEAYQQARLAVEACTSAKWSDIREDVGEQIEALFSDHFLIDTPWSWLSEFPRYLRAIPYRLERLGAGAADRDRQAMTEIKDMQARYRQRRMDDQASGEFNPELVTYRWMLEEYRVSCFAQPLGTSISVSPQRLEKQWTKVTA